MSIPDQETPVVDEERWNLWLLKGKQEELRTRRKIKRAAALLLIVLVIGTICLLRRSRHNHVVFQ